MNCWVGYLRESLMPKEKDIKYVDIREKPFRLYGINELQTANYHRLPEEIANGISGGVAFHARASAGVRVCFATNSPFIAIKAVLDGFSPSPHVADLAAKGFDLYTENDGDFVYHNSFYPPMDTPNEVVGITYFQTPKKQNVIINFPVGTAVEKVEIGIRSDAEFFPANCYRDCLPIVYYGSSITQGFAASRPGNTYENFISRELKTDYLNYGFSGSALGEANMANYIATIQMSALVIDYDHNAPDVEHLQKTHYAFYKIIRDKNPDLPIVVISRPNANRSDDTLARKKVIVDTFTKAKTQGDDHIFFVDGGALFPYDLRNDCTVDGTHPNDLGMYYMARGMLKVLAQILPRFSQAYL